MNHEQKSKFDYWQLKELDQRYAKSNSGCWNGISAIILFVFASWFINSTLFRLERLEKAAGIELTGRQLFGLDPDPIMKQLNQQTPTK